MPRLPRAFPVVAALLALHAPLLHAEVKDASANGFTLENVEVVPAPPARAWEALVEEVGRWWPADHTWWGAAGALSIEARAGGCFCEIAGDRQASHMTVVMVDPGRLLRMTGGLGPLQGMGVQGVLEWRLEEVGEDGTRIGLYYRAGGHGPDDLAAFAPVVDKVQAQQLRALAEHLRGGAAQH